MKLSNLKIKTKNQNYNIIIGFNLISNIQKIIEKNHINFNKCLLVIDKNISKKIVFRIKKSFIKKKFILTFFMQVKKIKIKKV